MNAWALKHWLVAEIRKAREEYRVDKTLYEVDVTVLPYFCGRIETLEKVLRVLTGRKERVE